MGAVRTIEYKLKKNVVTVRLVKNAIFISTQKQTYHAYYPLSIEDIDQALIDLMIWILFYGFGENETDGRFEFPALSGKRTTTYTDLLVSYSGGVDSTVMYLLSPVKTHCAYIYRDYAEMYGLNQQEAIDKIGAHRIHTDFERIRELYVPGQPGFNVGSGYVAMMLPFVDSLKVKYIGLGGIYDDLAFGGNPYRYACVVNPPYSRLDHLMKVLSDSGIEMVEPVSGLSKVLLTQVMAGSEFRDIVSSCNQDPAIMKGNYCRKCYKCFKKLPILGDRIDLDEPRVMAGIMQIMNRRPLRTAGSVIYAIQKAGYGIERFQRYLDIDVSFLDRYSEALMRRYNPPEMCEMMYPVFEKAGISRQTEEDARRIERFVERMNEDSLYE